MLLFSVASLLSVATPSEPNLAQVQPTEQIRVMPVQKTPESNTVMLIIASPKEGELKMRNPVWVQFRLDGYPLGAGSQFDRENEIGVSKMGQTVHVVVDDNPYFSVDEPAIDPFNEDGYFYDTRYKFEIPYPLRSGMHTIRMFPARSYGESLKGDNTFQMTYFYVGNSDDSQNVDFDLPFLTYNEPGDQIVLNENRPVLLDFYLRNCELTTDGYKVILTVDGKNKRVLTSWQPYYIYGLKKGKHTIRLQLVNAKGQVVKGPFANDVERVIRIQGQ